MRKIMIWIFIMILLLNTLTGCGKSYKPDPHHPVTITMWHNYGGDMQEAMDYLIDEFNSTVGKKQGIVINVTAISSSSDLNDSLLMIVNGDPGAPQMPDIFTGYPKIAVQFQNKGMLVNFNDYFTKKELAAYVDAFINEGKLTNEELYVFPVAKSTEILYVNQTLFERFVTETGADAALLSSFEGIAALSEQYYQWTDAKTPSVQNDGKQFFSADSWFNATEVGMEQLSSHLFRDSGALNLDTEQYTHIFETIYSPAVKGGFAICDGYSSDLSKTGDLVCSTGSSAGILFYGDTITYSDGNVENVEYDIFPYPVFQDGKKVALQRGGGLMVAKSDPQKEYAATVFIKWLTAYDQNMKFISKTGYLPVTKQAFEDNMSTYLQTVEDKRIQKMLTSVISMYQSYEFFTAPNLTDLDEVSKNYEIKFKSLLGEHRDTYQTTQEYLIDDALHEMKK